MLEFISFILPSFISISIDNNQKDKVIGVIKKFGLYCSINNLITLAIIIIKHSSMILGFDYITINFCFKYILLQTIIAILTPYIISIIKQNIKINVEVKRNEKK